MRSEDEILEKVHGFLRAKASVSLMRRVKMCGWLSSETRKDKWRNVY